MLINESNKLKNRLAFKRIAHTHARIRERKDFSFPLKSFKGAKLESESILVKMSSKKPRPGRIVIQKNEGSDVPLPPRNLDKKATITIEDKTFEVEADDLEKIADLGRGAYGVVEKMRHVKTGTVMAVKRITATVNTQEQKRLLMDLDISMRSSDCSYTVHFYGALFREGDVWICMEVMECSLDKFYPIVFDNNRSMPEGKFILILKNFN